MLLWNTHDVYQCKMCIQQIFCTMIFLCKFRVFIYTYMYVLQKYKVFLTDEIHRCDFVPI